MDSDSATPSEPNLTGPCVGEEAEQVTSKIEGDSSVGEGDTLVNSSVEDIDTAAASELVPLNAVAGISDVAELFPVHPIDSVGGLEEERAALIAGEESSAADSPRNGGDVDKVQANLLGLNGGKDLISEDVVEENKENSKVEEPSLHDSVDSLKAEEKREDVEEVMADEDTQATENELGQNKESEKVQVETTSQVASLEDIVSDENVDEEGTQATENELGQNIESEKVQVEATSQAASLEGVVSDDIEIPDVEEVMADEEGTQAAENELGQNIESEKVQVETTSQVASLKDIVSDDIEIPDDKEVASVAGFMEIPSQGKGLDGSVFNLGTEFVKEEPLKELQMGEGAKDLSDGDAKADLYVAEDAIEAKDLSKGDAKENVDVAEDAMDIQALKKTKEEENHDALAVVETQEVDDHAPLLSSVEVSDKNVASVLLSTEVPDKNEAPGLSSTWKESVMVDGKEDVEKISEADVTTDVVEDEDQEKDYVMTDVADDVEAHGDSPVADKTEAPVLSSTGKETVMVDGKEDVEKNFEADVTTDEVEDEDQEKDYAMTDVADDVKAHGDSPVADIQEETEVTETHEESVMADIEEETELTETQEESVMADTGDEEPEEVEEENKGAGGKRKRGRNTKTMKGTGKKKEEDVCFMCFDGGDLVLCDRRGCPKAYHPSCVDRDEAFFRSKGKWNCGWHLCSKCEKAATYLCYTCMFSVCKGCVKDAVFFCVRGNKGLCETCMETVKLIEKKELEKKEPAQLDFDDKTSWEYLFKDYWIDLKTQLSLSPEELDQAKSPGKGHEPHPSKHGTANETDYATDGGSDSDSSPKKRKTRSRSKSGSTEKILSPARKRSSGETMEWASKELLDVVAHMRRGDRSSLPHSEVHKLLLEYIKRYNLRDPRRKSQVICDSRLQNLFGKSHVGHFEMLNLLESHFLEKEQNQADNTQGSIVDTEPDQVDVDENLDHPVKSGKDKKRKTRKKGGRKGRQSNLDDFAAVDIHNINLIYLRRSLVEDLLDDSTAFEEKVASAFVRLRISGNQKQDLYRLVQVVGTSKAPEPYKVGKKTTDFVLEILNLDKTEVISIDIISNQDFTEDECKRLKQSIKCGLINRLTVGDIQEKAIALQEVRVKNVLEAEILRFSHLRDRASDMGRRKELRECVEKLQLLKSPEERQRRLEEIPEIHADPKMDPDCESEDEDEKEEKEKEKHLRPRSSSFNRRGRDPISPRKGGFSSNESWTGTSNYNSTSVNRELSRSYSGRGSSGREDYPGSSDDKFGETMWTSGRERETQQSLGSEKPRSISLPETAVRSSRSIVPPLELSPRITSEISTTPPAVILQPVPKLNESEKMWHYKDPSGKVQGPFSMTQLRKWNNTGYFPTKLEIWKAKESPLDSILLTDALAGLFQKQTQLVDNSYTKAPVAAYSGQSGQSEPNSGSTPRISPSIVDIPRNSQDTWSSGGSLPSPTPNQITTPTAKRRNFESRWSPTKPSSQTTVQPMNLPLAQSVPSQASRTDIPVVFNSAGTHPIPTPDITTASGNHYSSAATLPSPTPAGGKSSWGSLQTEKFDSYGRGGGEAPSSQNSSVSYGTTTPSVIPPQSQPGFPSSDPWRVPVPAPSQSNTQAQVQAPATNLPWGMNTVNNSQNSIQPQAPANQNNSWGQGTGNTNMGWVGPVQAGTNANWAASSVPPTGQGIPNPGWGGPVQGQAQAYPNAGWGVAGQAQSQVQVQVPGSSTSSGWVQPGQGIQSGNSNQNWGAQNQMAIPSSGSGGNQGGFWGNQQNQNGDSGYGWNRQTSGSGGQNSFKGQRVCKFFREDGYCRKGASCNYLHN